MKNFFNGVWANLKNPVFLVSVLIVCAVLAPLILPLLAPLIRKVKGMAGMGDGAVGAIMVALMLGLSMSAQAADVPENISADMQAAQLEQSVGHFADAPEAQFVPDFGV